MKVAKLPKPDVMAIVRRLFCRLGWHALPPWRRYRHAQGRQMQVRRCTRPGCIYSQWR